MTDIPIIFSAPMVRALIDGRKTMTRRLAWRLRDVGDNHTKVPTAWQKVNPGDRLWVRENVRLVSQGPDQTVGISYAADGDMPSVHFFEVDQHKLKRASMTPCIHMPRWASRLSLIVTATRIERLQDMSEADALAEGVEKNITGYFGVRGPLGGWLPLGGLLGPDFATASETFQHLWRSLHGVESWNDNPEVVAMTFTVQKHNIDAMASAA